MNKKAYFESALIRAPDGCTVECYIADRIGASLNDELKRTAEMLVEISERSGVYFAVAFLYDSSYDTARIKKLLPILQNQAGAIKKT